MRAVEGKNIKRTNFHCRVIKVLLPFWLLVSPPYYSPIFHSCRDFLLLLLPLLFTQAEKQLNICKASLTSPPHPKATAASTVQPCKCRPRIHTSSSKAGPTPEVIAVSPAAIRGPRMHWPPLGFSSPHSCLSISVKVREQRASLMINTPQPHPTQAPAALIHDLYNSFLWLRLSRFSLLKYPSLNNKIQLFFKKKKIQFTDWKSISQIFSTNSKLWQERITKEWIFLFSFKTTANCWFNNLLSEYSTKI